ncbi:MULTISPECIES: hypothetical protein [unclassified Planococcus (in: firmicutes)]|uniref:hypothetical protein n=1 Tax=Planococcus TaxID=1372 RepID=UPI001E5D32BA|nr:MULTISPECIES: hypothetical protein [unclassified Planococcus (in: firmicutes)]
MGIDMKKFIASGAALGAGLILLKAYNGKKRNVWVYEDSDMHNSYEIDHEESVNAPYDHAEQGLTQLDSAYRSEWQANAFPQTKKQLEELES